MQLFRPLAILMALGISQAAMALEIDALWDFNKPELSEQRFCAALFTARGDDALILQTQIARSYGLRRNFTQAQAMLKNIESQVQGAGPEARVRYTLELGRTLASAVHPPESQTPETREQARAAYLRAFDLAKTSGLDALAIDALHMMAFVDVSPIEQLKWGSEALAIVESSTQPAAKKWEASLRNNVGYALHQLGRYEDALTEFNKAVVLRRNGADAEATRVAYWMVARTLRVLDRLDEALEIQLRLERESEAAGAPDPYVFEELEVIYRAKKEPGRAAAYSDRKAALSKQR